MSLLAHFLLSVRLDELFDDHETTSDANDETPIEDLRIDLPCAEHVETIAQALDRNRAASFIDVVAEQLIQHVTLFAREHLSRLLVLALLDDGLMQVVNLLAADFELSLNSRQVCLTSLH